MLLLSLALSAPALASPPPFASLRSFMDALGGEIPYPPRRMLEKLMSQNAVISGTILPHGRSLERGCTNARAPRTLLALNFIGQGDEPGQEVFLAYTPDCKHRLQIMSRSKNQAVFDFSVVSNYRLGQKPVLRPALSQGLCISCHQEGTPIFPQFPWKETENNPRVERQIQRGHEPFANFLLRLRPAFANPGAFEGAVMLAQESMTRARSCSLACGDSLECRRNILAAAILTRRTQDELFKYFTPERSSNWIRQIATRGYPRSFAMPAPILNDHDPFEPLLSGELEDPLAPRPPKIDQFVDFFDLEANPITERNLKYRFLSLVDFASSCLPVSDEFYLWQIEKQLAYDSVITSLQSAPVTQILRQSWPPTPKAVLLAFQGQAHPRPTTYAPYSANLASFRELTGPRIGSLSVPHRSTLELFKTYCSSCHEGSYAAAGALPLQSLEALRKYVGEAGRTVRNMISAPDRLMPPVGSFYPTDAERDEMLRAVSP